VDYGFGNFRKITKYSFFSSYSNNAHTPNSWVLRGSHDGVTWVDLDSQDTQAWAIEERWKLYEIIVPDYYRFYMLDIVDEVGSSYLAFDELKFYGENFASCPLEFNAFESLPGWVCFNGSFTDVSDEASKTVSSIYSASYILNNAFDEILEGGTPYISTNGVHTATVSIDFGASNEKILTRYDFFSSYSNNVHTPNSWTFEGSNDNTNWDILDTRNNQAWGITERWKVYSPVNTGSYRYYRFIISDEVGASYLAFDEMKFYVNS